MVAPAAGQEAVDDRAEDEKIVQQASAYRLKYAVRRCRLHASLVAPHPKNRDGIGVNGSRCDDLLVDFQRVGFDSTEADHDAICIEEVPGRNDILTFNMKMCKNDDFLADVVEKSLPYGSIAHSHVNQVLRNSIGGARSSLKRLIGGDGRIHMELVKNAMPLFYKACASGLLWEILSYVMLQEAPEAADIIQAACNIKGGLAMMEHEMQAISRLSKICSTEMSVANRVAKDVVRERIRRTMPDLATSAEFYGVIAFVVDLGADEGEWIADLCRFHGAFVNAKKRRLRWSAFTAVVDLGDIYPYCKVALIKYAYGISAAERLDANPSDPFIDVLRSADVRKLVKSMKEPEGHTEGCVPEAEVILRFFHQSMSKFAKIEDAKSIAFLAALDIGMARCMLGKTAVMPEGLAECTTIIAVADIMFDNLKKMVSAPADSQVLKGKPWKSDHKRPPVEPTLEPIVLSFAGGEVQNHQTVVAMEDENEEVEALPWSVTLRSAFANKEQHRLLVQHALWTLASRLPVLGESDLEFLRTNNKIKVRAKREFDKGELALVPLVHSLLGTVVDTASVPTFAVKAMIKDLEKPVYILPQVKAPSTNSVALASGSEERGWFLPPFWCLRRSMHIEEANCRMADVEVNMVTSASGSQSLWT